MCLRTLGAAGAGWACKPSRGGGRGAGERRPSRFSYTEAGVRDFEVVGFYGVLAPIGIPPAVLARLSRAFAQALESPDIRNRMIQQGADPAYLDAAGFSAFLKAELPRWANAVAASGARVD